MAPQRRIATLFGLIAVASPLQASLTGAE